MWGESPVTFRRLKNLIHGLPRHGNFGRVIGAYEAQPWQNAEELLATVAELTHEVVRTLVVVNSKKGARKPDPLRIERPHKTNYKPPPKRNASKAELEAIFGPMNKIPKAPKEVAPEGAE